MSRELAVELFNLTWTSMGNAARTPDDDDAMLEAAFASAHFWRQAGKPENVARSQWQLSRVYVVLKRAEPAIYHARRCLDVCEANYIWDWDRAFAYEALARAYALAGDVAETDRYLDEARTLGERIEKKEDRDPLFADLETIALP